MSSGNGQRRFPLEVFTTPEVLRPDPSGQPRLDRGQPAPSRRSLAVSTVLFAATLLSTLAVGAQFSLAYARDRAPDVMGFFSAYAQIAAHPILLLDGVPFAFTLMGILLAHELGHFFACRHYGIAASYPYFLPAPTLIGTLGAFIRIRSPIVNRRALFDVGLAGPVVGFLLAAPALAVAVAYSKVVPGAQAESGLIFGEPLLAQVLIGWLRPGVNAGDLLLHPVGRAAWVGLFATALNLLPAGQLDGGHILYSLANAWHRRVSFVVALLLVPLAIFCWAGWFPWAVLLLVIGFRHPPLRDPGQSLDRSRLVWAAIALFIFLLCFTPWPFEGQAFRSFWLDEGASAVR